MIYFEQYRDKEQASLQRFQQRAYLDLLDNGLNPGEKEIVKASNYDVILYLEQHLDKVENYLKGQGATPHSLNLLLRIKKIRAKYNGDKD